MKEIIQDLKQRGLKVATAESCTGGLLASSITDISGASGVFELGIVSYSNEIKINVLGVSPETIENYGVYSLQTAEAMAKAVKNKANADIGIGITGVAGSEPQEGVPSGKVFIALAGDDALLFAETDPSENSTRLKIKETARNEALSLLKKYLEIKEKNG